jgi:hypothetical protein
LGKTEKARRATVFFCIGNFGPFSLKTSLILPHARVMSVFLPLYHVFIFLIKKKKLGEKMLDFYFFSFLGMSNIACVFA